MEEQSWMQMLIFLQELHHLSRSMLVQGQKQPLTASELELLSRLYLQAGPTTPMELSRLTGMKKEAVSRCLRQLLQKGDVNRAPHPDDERSCLISLTESGRNSLEACYGPILRPIYALRRSMGDDFDTLFRLIEQANRQAHSETSREETHEIL